MERKHQGRRTGADRASGPRSGERAAPEPSPPAPADPWNDRLLAHFLKVGAQPGGADRLAASADSVRATIERAVARGRYTEALELARVAEPAYLAAGRWGAWASILGAALDAARASADRTAEGWALHQLGMRALALGQPEKARRLLLEALAVRAGHVHHPVRQALVPQEAPRPGRARHRRAW